MIESERPTFAEAMLRLGEIYREEISKLRAESYWAVLREYELLAVLDGMAKHVAESQFFPKPNEILAQINGSKQDRAVRAWDRFVMAVRHHGPSESVDFHDPVLHTTIEAMGGWHVIAASLPEDPVELGYRRHEFLERHRSYQRALPGPAKTYLPGTFEIQNSAQRGSWDATKQYLDTVKVLSLDGTRSESRRALAMTQEPVDDAMTERAKQGMIDLKAMIAALPAWNSERRRDNPDDTQRAQDFWDDVERRRQAK